MTNIYLTNLEDLNSFKKLETIFKKAFDEKDTSSKDLALQLWSTKSFTGAIQLGHLVSTRIFSGIP